MSHAKLHRCLCIPTSTLVGLHLTLNLFNAGNFDLPLDIRSLATQGASISEVTRLDWGPAANSSSTVRGKDAGDLEDVFGPVGVMMTMEFTTASSDANFNAEFMSSRSRR